MTGKGRDGDGGERDVRHEETDAGFEALLQHIKEQRGFDFTGYKRASLLRRVRRRMEVVEAADYEEYLDRLLLHPSEFTQLFNTILINVTGFFRDPASWDYLQTELLPDILERRQGQPVRAWVAGCASGQEAYTLAMVLAEELGTEAFRERVKIYATDVDEEALTQARQGIYTEQEMTGVEPALREKYFEPVGDRFAFRKELRRSVIFGRNDLVQDAPISHVDVLTCRNTLMYFNAEAQTQILGRLHFALRPHGVLFLGKAEMLLSHTAYFRPREPKRRFFQKVQVDTDDRRIRVPGPVVGGDGIGPSVTADLLQAALMASASAQIVLDPEGRLVLSNHRAAHQFGLTARDLGRPVQDLEISYRPVELRAALQDVRGLRRPVVLRDVEHHRGGEHVTYDVHLAPLVAETGADIGVTVVFTDVTQTRLLQVELTQANRQLEVAYEELQSTNEELETTNEELQSTVEELETTNEELQSTNEELETMNEELQSINDELHLSNEALREGQDEVQRVNRFMAAVLGSMDSGVAVVDGDLRILAWNSRAEDLWGVRSDEAVGEHLMNLDIGLPVENLRQPLRARIASDDGSAHQEVLDAVSRRGRQVRVRVTVTRLEGHDQGGPCAMLAMDVVPEGASPTG